MDLIPAVVRGGPRLVSSGQRVAPVAKSLPCHSGHHPGRRRGPGLLNTLGWSGSIQPLSPMTTWWATTRGFQ